MLLQLLNFPVYAVEAPAQVVSIWSVQVQRHAAHQQTLVLCEGCEGGDDHPAAIVGLDHAGVDGEDTERGMFCGDVSDFSDGLVTDMDEFVLENRERRGRTDQDQDTPPT